MVSASGAMLRAGRGLHEAEVFQLYYLLAPKQRRPVDAFCSLCLFISRVQSMVVIFRELLNFLVGVFPCIALYVVRHQQVFSEHCAFCTAPHQNPPLSVPDV